MVNEAYSKDRNFALCRNELDFIPNGNFVANRYEECHNMSFFKINGLTKFWNCEQDFSINSLIGDILNSSVRNRVPFAYAIIGNENGINVYVGTLKILVESLKSSYEAVFPGIDIEYTLENPLRTSPNTYGGMFTGIPTDKLAADKKVFQIENICRGMQGKKFTYVILASGISDITVLYGHEKLLQEKEEIFPFINQTITGGAQGNQSIQKQNFSCKEYFENLEILEQSIKIGMIRGMWRVNGYFAADSVADERQLGSIIKASFSGGESRPEPFRIIEYNSIKDVISNIQIIADLAENPELHPLGKWKRTGDNQVITLYNYKFQTILNSNQLATMCQLPSKEFPGFYLDEYVEFDISNRTFGTLTDPIPIGDICLAGRKGNLFKNNIYYLEKKEFTRHALVIGITGGGKTNTSKALLNTLWNTNDKKEKIPFMVIESAKREYWELRNLKGFEDLIIFTLGAEAKKTSVRYRINPFETNPKISLQTHIDYLLSTFKAAFGLYPPLPSILEKAVYEIYSDRGWDIVENINRYGLSEYPTLSELYNKIDVIVDNMGYHYEVQSNVKAALQTRIYSLMIGGKGAMLNTPKSLPIEELLSKPVVLELEDLGDDETKSFVIGLLLVQLYEYRKSQMTIGSKELSHILVVEEAHRLLKNVSDIGEGGSTQAKSVEFFCNLLAEIRTYGQGILIADQIPTKLAPDTIKNTNLKIVHRTVAQDDRETIGRAMNMTAEQIEYLSSLKCGYAAVYAEGDNRPKCIKLPLVKSYYEKTRDEVIAEVQQKVRSMANGYDEKINHHAGCAYCEQRCQFYDEVSLYINNNVATDRVLEKYKKNNYAPVYFDLFINSDLMRNLNVHGMFMKICILGYVLNQAKDMNDGQRQKYITEYIKYISEK